MYSKEKTITNKIAKKAGKMMLNAFNEQTIVEYKEDLSPVTITDKKINEMVIEEIKKEFPDDEIIGEEISTTQFGGKFKKRLWICDPIDGTDAFISGIPTAMFSLALIENGTPILGVVFAPLIDKLYFSQKGFGAECNGKKITKKKESSRALSGSRISVSSNVRKLQEGKGATLAKELMDKGAHLVLCPGAVYKMCLIAENNIDAYISFGVTPIDIAGAHLLVTELGGKITDLNGNEIDYTKMQNGAIISNGLVHKEILGIVKEI